MMSALNDVPNERTYSKMEPEVFIELPEPKLITDDCTIIINGHHNYGMSEEKDNGIREDAEEETEPFLGNTKSPRTLSILKPETLIGSNSLASDAVSSNMFPLKESSTTSSLEEDSDADVEPESSTHLLQNQEQDHESPKCLRTKTKLPTFRHSPSKKHASVDVHSHVQHRPLGMPQNTLSTHFFFLKWNWTAVRFACLGLLVSAFLGIGCLVIGLYVTSPNDCETKREWWQGTTMYEIFPASFQDTDGDGFGDMRGLMERLDYIQNLSVDVVRLNSIFSALDYPLEYEHVIDFANIDPHLGRLEDFQELVKELHRRGLYVILDMNPTVTSDQHTWAAHWLLHRPGRYEHYYVNITEDEEEPPLESNPDYSDQSWTPPHRTFGNHLYLNWSNTHLQREMREVMEFWLSQGVDGFYMKHLENLHVVDEAHVASAIHQWRYVLDKYSVNSTRKVLMVSHATMEHLKAVMDSLSYITLPSFIDLVDASINLVVNGSIQEIGQEVQEVQEFWAQFPVSPMIVWHLGSVETMRLASKIGEMSNMAGFFLLSVLPGSMSSFYGDEIGMQDSFDLDTSKVYQGGQLAPMQWTSHPYANFTSEDSTPWLPLHPNYITLNVESQSKKLSLFGQLMELKNRGDPLVPSQSTPSLMHSLVVRLSNLYEETSPQYMWFHNSCGLVVAKITHSSAVFVLIANYGSDVQFITEDIQCGDKSVSSFLTSSYLSKRVDILLSTNSSFIGQIELHHLQLEPGDAIIGRFIT